LELTLHSAIVARTRSPKNERKLRDIWFGKDISPLADDYRVDSPISFKPKTDGKIMTEANIQLDEVDSPGTTLV
jgi:hypothetical protein